jgi:ribosomal protein S18 acetylase RimI-like enzyme
MNAPQTTPIESLRITTADVAHYQFMERLLVSSFPPEERRPLPNLRRVTDEKENFHLFVLMDGATPVGFYNYWSFPLFCYTEHLAVSPEYRNRRYGTQAIASLLTRFDLPLVIEVEPPVTETALRRIAFYRRQGFRLWERPYLQPPYSPEVEGIPLRLMTCRTLDLADDDLYNMVCRTLRREVYGQP